MSNYVRYREDVGISNADMIKAIRATFRNYSGATNAMVNNPDKYGVCLLPKAEQILAAHFGGSRELDWREDKPVRKACLRKKPNRLSVYLSDEMFEQFKTMMHHEGCDTVQNFLLKILTNYLGG